MRLIIISLVALLLGACETPPDYPSGNFEHIYWNEVNPEPRQNQAWLAICQGSEPNCAWYRRIE